MILVLDIGGRFIRTGIIDQENNIIFFDKQQVNSIIQRSVAKGIFDLILNIPVVRNN